MFFYVKHFPIASHPSESLAFSIPSDAFTAILGALLFDPLENVSTAACEATFIFLRRLNSMTIPPRRIDPLDLRPPPLPVPKLQERRRPVESPFT